MANDLTWVDTGTDLVYVSSAAQASATAKVVDRRLDTGAIRWSTSLGGDASASVVRPAGGNLIVTENPGPGNSSAALAVDQRASWPGAGRDQGSSSRTATTPARISSPPTNCIPVGTWCSSTQANPAANSTSAIATKEPSFGPSRRAAAMPAT